MMKIRSEKTRFLSNRRANPMWFFPQIFRIRSKLDRAGSHLSHTAENHESDWNPHDFPNSDSDDNKNPRKRGPSHKKKHTHTTPRQTDRRTGGSQANWKCKFEGHVARPRGHVYTKRIAVLGDLYFNVLGRYL